jgi:quercetin dioxygenase-like cupin family protein
LQITRRSQSVISTISRQQKLFIRQAEETDISIDKFINLIEITVIMPYINFSTRKNVKIWEGITARMFHSEKITFAHVTLQAGAVVQEHHHVHEQWTHLVEGEMRFKIDGEEMTLTPGMAALVPSNKVHSAQAITNCFVIDCFLPVREDLVKLEQE